MAEATPTYPADPKKHSPFVQVVLRKLGETFDLGGKAVVGLAGVGSFVHMDHAPGREILRLVVGLSFGGSPAGGRNISAGQGRGDLTMDPFIAVMLMIVGAISIPLPMVFFFLWKENNDRRKKTTEVQPAE